VPISIWILTNFIQDLPPELDEAALVDGASRLQTLRQVILPLVRPGLAATAVICLLYTWNEFLYALILTGKDAKTAPVAIVGFMTNKEIYWGKIAGGARPGSRVRHRRTPASCPRSRERQRQVTA
jgi:multiple sugar transport system permease protein